MVDVAQTVETLDKYFTIYGSYQVDPNTGRVTVTGDISTQVRFNFRRLPMHLEKITGTISLYYNKFQTLEGFPRQVGKNMDLGANKLSNLVGGPQVIVGDLDLTNNPLINLDGSPDHVGGVFRVSYASHLPLLRTLVAQRIDLARVGVPSVSMVQSVLNKYAGKGRKGAIPAAKEIMQAGEQVQREQSLDHNPFEANARW